MTFEAIFASTFKREIGLQFFRSQRSKSFFSMRVITACFCDELNSPFSDDTLKHSTRRFPIEPRTFCKILPAFVTWNLQYLEGRSLKLRPVHSSKLIAPSPLCLNSCDRVGIGKSSNLKYCSLCCRLFRLDL